MYELKVVEDILRDCEMWEYTWATDEYFEGALGVYHSELDTAIFFQSLVEIISDISIDSEIRELAQTCIGLFRYWENLLVNWRVKARLSRAEWPLLGIPQYPTWNQEILTELEESEGLSPIGRLEQPLGMDFRLLPEPAYDWAPPSPIGFVEDWPWNTHFSLIGDEWEFSDLTFAAFVYHDLLMEWVGKYVIVPYDHLQFTAKVSEIYFDLYSPSGGWTIILDSLEEDDVQRLSYHCSYNTSESIFYDYTREEGEKWGTEPTSVPAKVAFRGSWRGLFHSNDSRLYTDSDSYEYRQMFVWDNFPRTALMDDEGYLCSGCNKQIIRGTKFTYNRPEQPIFHAERSCVLYGDGANLDTVLTYVRPRIQAGVQEGLLTAVEFLLNISEQWRFQALAEIAISDVSPFYTPPGDRPEVLACVELGTIGDLDLRRELLNKCTLESPREDVIFSANEMLKEDDIIDEEE